MKKILALFSIILLLVILCFIITEYYNKNFVKTKPVPVVRVENVDETVPDTIATTIAGKDVYVTDNINDENLGIVTEPLTTVSYWYVTYNVHIADGDKRWEGWQVLELKAPYFDTYAVIYQLVPAFVKEDYVGIDFFKRVPLETYQAYIRDTK